MKLLPLKVSDLSQCPGAFCSLCSPTQTCPAKGIPCQLPSLLDAETLPRSHSVCVWAPQVQTVPSSWLSPLSPLTRQTPALQLAGQLSLCCSIREHRGEGNADNILNKSAVYKVPCKLFTLLGRKHGGTAAGACSSLWEELCSCLLHCCGREGN